MFFFFFFLVKRSAVAVSLKIYSDQPSETWPRAPEEVSERMFQGDSLLEDRQGTDTRQIHGEYREWYRTGDGHRERERERK